MLDTFNNSLHEFQNKENDTTYQMVYMRTYIIILT